MKRQITKEEFTKQDLKRLKLEYDIEFAESIKQQLEPFKKELPMENVHGFKPDDSVRDGLNSLRRKCVNRADDTFYETTGIYCIMKTTGILVSDMDKYRKWRGNTIPFNPTHQTSSLQEYADTSNNLGHRVLSEEEQHELKRQFDEFKNELPLPSNIYGFKPGSTLSQKINNIKKKTGVCADYFIQETGIRAITANSIMLSNKDQYKKWRGSEPSFHKTANNSVDKSAYQNFNFFHNAGKEEAPFSQNSWGMNPTHVVPVLQESKNSNLLEAAQSIDVDLLTGEDFINAFKNELDSSQLNLETFDDNTLDEGNRFIS